MRYLQHDHGPPGWPELMMLNLMYPLGPSGSHRLVDRYFWLVIFDLVSVKTTELELLHIADKMTVTIKNDPNDKSLFSNEGVVELIPPPSFDYRAYKLEVDEVEDLIQRVTEHLVHLKASDPRFTYTRKPQV